MRTCYIRLVGEGLVGEGLVGEGQATGTAAPRTRTRVKPHTAWDDQVRIT